MIKMYWWEKKCNFGDAINPLLVKQLFDIDVENSLQRQADLFGIGSILDYALKFNEARSLDKAPAYIWGSGSYYEEWDSLPVGKNVKVCAVRGELSRAKVQDQVAHPIAMGDPGLLFSRAWPEYGQHKHGKIAVVPHLDDKPSEFWRQFSDDSRFIVVDVESDPLLVMQQIAGSSLVLSSAMHGLIAADSYQVPNAWVNLSGAGGGGYKYDDYYSVTGKTVLKADLDQLLSSDYHHALIQQFQQVQDLVGIQDRLIAAFPKAELEAKLAKAQLKTDKYVVAFRTHVWDDTVAQVFDSLAENIDEQDWQLVILLDETNKKIPIPRDVPIITHDGRDVVKFGLPLIPKGQVLWRNGDYAIHFLKQGIDAPAYIIIENDTLVRGPKLFKQIKAFYDQGGDYVTARFEQVGANHWHVRKSVGPTLSAPFAQSYVWLWGGTRRTADILLQERLALLEKSDMTDNQWPVDEIFLGTTAIKQAFKKLVVTELDDISTKHLDYRPAYSVLDTQIWQGNQLVHPAVSQGSIFEKYAHEINWMLKRNPQGYQAGSNLWRQMMLSHLDQSNQSVYNNIIRNFIWADGFDEQDFAAFASQHNLVYEDQLDPRNLALLKTVDASPSISPRVRLFAYGRAVVDGNFDVDKYRYGGYASKEQDHPWLTIDLAEVHPVSQIKLYHREGFFERTQHIKIAVSTDGTTYQQVADLQGIVFEKTVTQKNKQGYVYLKTVNIDAVEARFVRFELVTERPTIFNLNQIEIFE